LTGTGCSIVIRAYNEETHIGRLLEGVMQQSVHPEEIILVDSGSTDSTLSVAARYPVKILHISPQEFTFGRSLNLGISETRSELLVFASAHVYPVYPDWLERLLAPFSEPKVALAYGKQRGSEESLFSEQQIFRSWFPDGPQNPQAHPFCNNANAAIRRSLWEQHPYDESLPGLEDLEWANWAIQQGFRVAYVPEAEIIHVHSETLQGVRNRYQREAMAFKRIFPHEHFRAWDFTRLLVSNSMNDMKQSARQRVFLKSWKSILWFRWMQFFGTYLGYRQSGPLTWQLKQTFYYPAESGPAAETSREVTPIHYSS
jgi:glycosyltransferase involved in cell wall biosynthesis